MAYEYKATLIRVVDGDTVWLNVDLGFNIRSNINFRLEGLNTPEIVGTDKLAGLASKAELERLLGLGSMRIISMKTEKYGRWLAIIHVRLADGTEINLNQTMIYGGFALPYSGTGPKPV